MLASVGQNRTLTYAIELLETEKLFPAGRLYASPETATVPVAVFDPAAAMMTTGRVLQVPTNTSPKSVGEGPAMTAGVDAVAMQDSGV